MAVFPSKCVKCGKWISDGDCTPVSSGIRVCSRYPDAFAVDKKTHDIYCWECGYANYIGDAGEFRKLMEEMDARNERKKSFGFGKTLLKLKK